MPFTLPISPLVRCEEAAIFLHNNSWAVDVIALNWIHFDFSSSEARWTSIGLQLTLRMENAQNFHSRKVHQWNFNDLVNEPSEAIINFEHLSSVTGFDFKTLSSLSLISLWKQFNRGEVETI